ncbi:hypothetical protein SDC9_211873 [bioreactor metagenome]|uniref:Uncharacterized protein n=1 Tax=bioreactor metagenome TaxID=1076179 RepID=A0A645JLG3_9ZZZZ
MRVERRYARAVLALARQLHADKIDEFKGVSAAESGVRHGGDDVAFLAALAQRRRVVIDHAADAVDNRQEGIAELTDLHNYGSPFPKQNGVLQSYSRSTRKKKRADNNP